jgi:hypothetical protein
MKTKIRNPAIFKIDIDTHRSKPIQRLNFRYKWLACYFPTLLPARFSVYRTKKGYHFYITPEDNQLISSKDIVLIQLALGSDWLREIRNWNRINDNFEHWNILFSDKVKDNKVHSERYVTSYLIRRC